MRRAVVLSVVTAVTALAFGVAPVSAHSTYEYHAHYVTAITGHYDGYYDYKLGRGCEGPCTLARTETMSYSNKWSASIQFEKGPIKVAVGYDVTLTESGSFTYSFPVPDGATKCVGYKDWYHVTTMNVRTDYIRTTYPYDVYKREYGTAWAGDWYKRIFYAYNC